MKRLLTSTSPVTRRGFLVGAGLIAAPFVVGSRAASVRPIVVRADRVYPYTALITSPDSLFQQLVVDRQAVQLLDASRLASFRDRHIPQARHVWWQDTMELNDRYYGMVLKPDDRAGNQGRRRRFLDRLGLTSTSPIVVYDDNDGLAAARVVWFLTFLGLSASLLDGGLEGWRGLGGPLSSDASSDRQPGELAIAPRDNFYLFANEINERLATTGGQLIDLRTDNERTSGVFRDRWIPGAVALPRSQLQFSDGLLLAPDDLETTITDAGIDLNHPLFLIAPTGVDCCLVWLALSLLGAQTLTICDGGWGQWIDTPGLPLEQRTAIGTD